MTESMDGDGVAPASRGGTTRRNVLIGAGTVATATAVATAIGGGTVSAAPVGGPFTCQMGPTIGNFTPTSFQFGAGRGVGAPPGREVTDLSVSEVTLTKAMDATSPKLLAAMTRGDTIPTVTISATGKHGSPAITYTLTNVILSGYSSSVGGELPFSESLSLNFTAITYAFDSTSVAYDLASKATTTSP